MTIVLVPRDIDRFCSKKSLPFLIDRGIAANEKPKKGGSTNFMYQIEKIICNPHQNSGLFSLYQAKTTTMKQMALTFDRIINNFVLTTTKKVHASIIQK